MRRKRRQEWEGCLGEEEGRAKAASGDAEYLHPSSPGLCRVRRLTPQGAQLFQKISAYLPLPSLPSDPRVLC